MVTKNSLQLGGDLLDLSSPNYDEFVTATITEHISKKEDKFPFSKYVVYRVDISTSVKSWSVWKRYTNFEELRERMSKHIFNLPEFPEKKIFNNNKDTISERKLLLCNFLNYLLTKEKILFYSDIQEFIEIDKETIRILINKSNLEVTSNTLKNSVSNINDLLVESSTKSNISNNYYSEFFEYKLSEPSPKTVYMQVIEEFLKNLEMKPQNKSSIIKTFEGFLKTKKAWPIVKTDEICKLYFGEIEKKEGKPSYYVLRGLLAHIGDIEENILGSEECLFLLVRLLESEFNPEFEKYLILLRQMKLEHLESMNLIMHLNNNKVKIKGAVIKLINKLYAEKSSRIEKLLHDAGLLSAYEQYIKSDEFEYEDLMEK